MSRAESEWPEITEPLLRERQAMSDEEFFAFQADLLTAIGTRELDEEHYQRAIGYPWGRPPGSCFVTDKRVESLAEMDADRRDHLVDELTSSAAERIPLLAYGANGSPERLSMKLAHLPEADHEALIVAGDLKDFDVGVAAQPPIYSSMPATLVPSNGTEVRVAVLFLTLAQFTALWWTELSYRVGALSDVVIRTDAMESPVERVIAFSSRYGIFTAGGAPVVMAALEARARREQAWTQIETLDSAARLALGDSANARDLIKTAYENPAAFMAEHFERFRDASTRFDSERWTELPA